MFLSLFSALVLVNEGRMTEVEHNLRRKDSRSYLRNQTITKKPEKNSVTFKPDFF